MPWVYFERDFDYRPTPISVVAYKAGTSKNVKREAAEQAVKEGRAYEIDTPKAGEVVEGKPQPIAKDKATVVLEEAASAGAKTATTTTTGAGDSTAKGK